MAQTQPTTKTPNPQPQPSPAQPSSSGKKVVMIVLIVLLVLGLLSALGGYLIYRGVKKAADKAGIEDINQVVREIEEYPDAYIAAGLPQYPDGRVASLSGKDATVDDGVSIVVSTPDAND